MKVFVATDVTIIRDGDRILVPAKYSSILRRYADAFGQLVLCARVGAPNEGTKKFDDITAQTAGVVPIGSLMGMLLNRNRAAMEKEMASCDLVIARCPAISPYRASDLGHAMGKKVLTEFMGDPWDAYWNHGLQGKLIAPYMFFKMKSVARRADYAVYVTTEFLQGRYPCPRPSIAASNVLIRSQDPEALTRREEKLKSFNPAEITLMTTAAVDVWYKGHEFVLQAMPKLMEKGIKARYLIVGEGDPSRLKEIAAREGVSDRVVFTGRLPLDEVFALLDEADLYLQPSLQEGLPRSVIEAMSRGCACIGARTAGIPELLPPDMVVRRKSADDIVRKVEAWVRSSSEAKTAMARRNWEEAGHYTAEILDARRNAYFDQIRKDITGQK